MVDPNRTFRMAYSSTVCRNTCHELQRQVRGSAQAQGSSRYQAWLADEGPVNNNYARFGGVRRPVTQQQVDWDLYATGAGKRFWAFRIDEQGERLVPVELQWERQAFLESATPWEMSFSKLARATAGGADPVVDSEGRVVGYFGWFWGTTVVIPREVVDRHRSLSELLKDGVSIFVIDHTSTLTSFISKTSDESFQLITSVDGTVIAHTGSHVRGPEPSAISPLDFFAVGKLAINLAAFGGRQVLKTLMKRQTTLEAMSGTKMVRESWGALSGAGARNISMSEGEYRAALEMVFPSQFANQIVRTVDGIGQRAAQRAIENPQFVAAVRSKNWNLGGTLFHSAAAQEVRTLPGSALPRGWAIKAERVIQAGKGGSRADVLLRGPAGEILEFDWKTTGRSALSYNSRQQMTRHAGQIAINIKGTLATQESRSWIDYVRPLLPGVNWPR